MRIFVTGGAGFIGSAVARHLVADLNHEIVVIDKLTYAANLDSLAPIASGALYHFEQVDICDREAIDSLFDKYEPEAVVHLAAESHVDRSISGARVFVDTNVVGTFTLLEAVRGYLATSGRNKADTFRMLHVSTDEVYGSLAAEGFFTEETPYDPSSPYSASKAASDHLAKAWHRTYGLPVIVSNCSNNYGPYHFPEKLIPLIILKAMAGESLPVYGDGSNVRDWLYVEDHARALAMILTRGRTGETYNVGGRNERRNIDVVRRICSIMDEIEPSSGPHDRLIEFVADRPGHDLRYAIDATKLETELGWTAKETLDSGIEKTVRWYINRRDWWEPLRDRIYRGERLGLVPRSLMRVFVTGAQGQLAQSLKIAASAASDIVVFCGSRPEFDLTRPETVRPLVERFKPDVVVNAAAYTAVDAAEADADTAHAVNCEGARAIATAAREVGAPVIQLSTDYVFDGKKVEPYDEGDATSPRTVYGRTKLAGEAAVAEANPRHLIARTAWVYSPYGMNFVKTMLRLARDRDHLRVVADQVGCPTYAPDLAATVLTIARRWSREGWRDDDAGVTHVAGPDAVSWCEFARKILSATKARGLATASVEAIATSEYPTPAKRPANSRLSTERLTSHFGLALPSLTDSLTACLDRIQAASER